MNANSRIEESLRALQLAVDKFSKDWTGPQLITVQKKLALQALRGIVQKTPVRTGRAKGNWQLTINVPSVEELDVRLPNEVFKEASNELNKLEAFQMVCITNNLPYIEKLENGSSKQAPGGMVSLTLQELLQQFK